MPWTRAHHRLVDAWVDLYRSHVFRGRTLRSLETWLERKFDRKVFTVTDLTAAQARQARRCLRAWGHFDGLTHDKRKSATWLDN